MTMSLWTKLADEILPPIVGQITVLNANTTAATIDLSTVGPGTLDMRNADSLPVAGGSAIPGSATPTNQNLTLTGAIGRFLEVYSDGNDVGVIFAANSAIFSNASIAANVAAAGTNAAGCCLRIPAGTYRSFVVHAASRYMSYATATGNANVRLVVTSRTG